MLDARIYRTGLMAVALAVIVVAFSLQNQPGGAQATLAPQAFNGQFAYSEMRTLSAELPNRRPGASDDYTLATTVAKAFHRAGGFQVSTSTFTARTVGGTKALENVTATRTGTSNAAIVIVAPRDSLSSPGEAAVSGTAALIELADVLSGQTLNHTIVLASTSGSDGGAGATELARQLPGPIDAVIALGDMASVHVRHPVVVPWSNESAVAPPELRNTVGEELTANAGLKPGGSSFAGQFAHLGFPLTITEQGPFDSAGEPAVLLSTSGERAPTPGAPVSMAQINGMGRTVVASINALDSAATVPAPSAYVLFGGKVVPPWAIRLFVLVLVLPVLGTVIDGLARANRRGHRLLAPVVAVVVSAVPFAVAALVIIGARLVGLLSAAPPAPVGPGTVPLHTGDIALLVIVGLIIVGGLALGHYLLPRPSRGTREHRDAGAAAVVPALMCAVTLALWVTNPYAALLTIPALHLWIWIVDPARNVHPLAAVALLLVGLAPAALVGLYYALSLGFGIGSLLWTGVLMVAGGQMGLVVAVEWCLMLGCTATVVALAARRRREPLPEPVPVTVRGPITYAGPGSLGGTKSALRR
jgi:hypothetical protein